MSTAIRKHSQVSLKQAVDFCLAMEGEVTPHLVGQKGIGKTSAIEKAVPDKYTCAFFDCTSLTLEDIGIMDLNREEKFAEYLFNKHWGFHLNKPLFIVLDEFTKAPKNLQAMLHGLLTKPRRIGSIKIHPDSIVVSTGNLKAEGVGDRMLGHTSNRFVNIYVRNSKAEEWIAWGIPAGIHPTVLAWAKRKPELFQSFVDDPEGTNEYISNPKRGDVKCVTGRSLEFASKIIWKFFDGKFGEDTLRSALEGTIGGRGATDLLLFIKMVEKLPSPEEIIADPETAKIPEDGGAVSITVSSALSWVDDAVKLGKWFTYMKRLPAEAQAYFILLGRTQEEGLGKIMMRHKAFQDWAVENEHMWNNGEQL